MKNKTPVMNESVQTKVPEWLHEASFMPSKIYYKGEDSLPAQRQVCFHMLQEIQDDDFLLGKTPNSLDCTWEDEE